MRINYTRTAFLASLVLAPIAALLSPHQRGPSFVLQLKGTAVGEMRNIDTDGDGVPDTMASCFDIDVIDPVSGARVGTASDCLSSVVIESDDPPANAPITSNIGLTGTTFFHLPGGTLVTQGQTSVRPVLRPTTRDGVDFTHITGANGDGGVQYGTGRFRGFGGEVRLSGQVDLARLGTHNEITFDCLFVIDAQSRRSHGGRRRR